MLRTLIVQSPAVAALGVRWTEGDAKLVGVTQARRNVSVALPADLQIDTHGALQSLQMGLLPITELDGTLGAQYRSANDAELRVDFLTSLTRSFKPVVMPNLNVALEPLKFMEFSLEGTTQGCVFANNGGLHGEFAGAAALRRAQADRLR